MNLYLSPEGNDRWSGRLAQPNADQTDGPLRSIAAALNKARGWFRHDRRAYDMRESIAAVQGPVTIRLHGGTYPITSPITLDDQCNFGLHFCAMPDSADNPPVITAGQALTGFRIEKHNNLTAWVLDLPEVKQGQGYFRSLFVNGRRAMRPRWPKTGTFTLADPLIADPSKRGWGHPGSDRFIAAEGDFVARHNLTDVDAIVLHFWIDERMPIKSYDPQTRMVTSTRTSRAPLVKDWVCHQAPYYLDNVYEALSEPGEWYLDRVNGRLIYLPLPGEQLETSTLIVPRLRQLLRIIGQPEQNKLVQHIRFTGISFAHTDWTMPGERADEALLFAPSGVHDDFFKAADTASYPQAAVGYPGAVSLRGARYCSFEDCTFEHLGWYALDIGEGCSDLRIIGNHLHDIGAGGIKIGGGDATQPTTLHTANLRITDNHLHDLGQVFHAGVGILLRHACNCIIAHNHIHDLYYSGISVGWVWGYGPSVTHDIRIEYNHIHDLGKGVLSDMGGIYTLGVQPGTTLCHNYIHHITCAGYGGWAIYPDEGSAHLVIENNVCHHTNSSVFHIHYGRDMLVRNNLFAFGGEGIIALGRCEAHRSATLLNNILIADGQPIYHAGYGLKPVEQAHAMDTDHNVAWDVSRPCVPLATEQATGTGAQIQQQAVTWERWQQIGHDQHTLVSDPGVKESDFLYWQPPVGSPADKVGFRPIDLRTVGPRPADQR